MAGAVSTSDCDGEEIVWFGKRIGIGHIGQSTCRVHSPRRVSDAGIVALARRFSESGVDVRTHPELTGTMSRMMDIIKNEGRSCERRASRSVLMLAHDAASADGFIGLDSSVLTRKSTIIETLWAVGSALAVGGLDGLPVLFRLQCEASARIHCGSAAVEPYYFTGLYPERIVGRFRRSIGTVTCFPVFRW